MAKVHRDCQPSLPSSTPLLVPKSQSSQRPAAAAAPPVRPQSMDTSAMETETLWKRQLADAEGFNFDTKACKLTNLPKAPPVDLSNTFQVLDSDLQAAGRSTDSPSGPKARRMPYITARLKVVSLEDLKMIQWCTSGDVRFEYVWHRL